MILPSISKELGSPIRIWIYGVPFSGKSTLAYQFENSYVINSDGNAALTKLALERNKDLTCGVNKILGVKNIKEMLAAMEVANNAKDCEVIVFDLIDDVFNFIRNHQLAKLNVEHESDVAFGKGWSAVKSQALNVKTMIQSLNKDIVFVSHQQEKTQDFVDRSGGTTANLKPIISDYNLTLISGMTHIFGRTFKQNNNYYVSFGVTDSEMSGTRLGFMKSKTIKASKDCFVNNFINSGRNENEKEKKAV